MKKIFSKIKYVKLKHIIGIIPFLIMIIPSFIYKLYLRISGKELWLICEQHNTARDNGICFFEYMVKEHPEIKCYYAIDENCKDSEKVKKIGKIINWGSFKHYFYYMACTKNISSHKDGNPNEFIFTIMHLYLNLYNNRVFLQHGITQNNIDMFYQENTKFKLFICGAKDEFDYVNQKFHYKNEEVVYTGFARFDNLHDINIKEKQIAIIPTWRSWLGREVNSLTKTDNFLESNYYNYWNKFLNDKKLIEHIEKNGVEIIFYPHIMMQKYIDNFKSVSKNIMIVKREDKDIQELLKESQLLITDYSSVFFDFAYMKKPIIYYQFDYAEFRKKHLKEGYFSYINDGFGEVCENNEELVNNIIDYINSKFKMKEKYEERMVSFFEKRDKNNCQRIYEAIIRIK